MNKHNRAIDKFKASIAGKTRYKRQVGVLQRTLLKEIKEMTKREKINRNLGLTFDFLRQILDKPEIIDKIPDGSILEFVEKDFSTIERVKGKAKRKYLKVVFSDRGYINFPAVTGVVTGN